jgi:hypothetical protein
MKVLKTLLAVVPAVGLSMAVPLMFEFERRAVVDYNSIEVGLLLRAWPLNLDKSCQGDSGVSTAKICHAGADKRFPVSLA